MTPQIIPPRGLTGIVKTFGDIEPFVSLDKNGKSVLSPEFERKYIICLELPRELWSEPGKSQKIKRIRCHRLLGDIFIGIFDEIVSRNLTGLVHSIDGCFVFRPKRTGPGLSTHSWGIAIDINATTNQAGATGDINLNIVDIFKKRGFTWGGDWKGNKRDPMHFQYCSGY